MSIKAFGNGPTAGSTDTTMAKTFGQLCHMSWSTSEMPECKTARVFTGGVTLFMDHLGLARYVYLLLFMFGLLFLTGTFRVCLGLDQDLLAVYLKLFYGVAWGWFKVYWGLASTLQMTYVFFWGAGLGCLFRTMLAGWLACSLPAAVPLRIGFRKKKKLGNRKKTGKNVAHYSPITLPLDPIYNSQSVNVIHGWIFPLDCIGWTMGYPLVN